MQDFPVVGIGASAGGVEAITSFVDALPESPGMAFVFIQHLPPDHQSLMVEILSRHTRLPVRQIEDGLVLERDRLYVTRPGSTVAVQGGRFVLGEDVRSRGHRRPIDDFYRSLANEQKERAFVVILSGMGTNGTAGAQAVKAAGGICIAQSPSEAQFPSMPESLIRSGYADQVLPSAEIPGVLLRYVEIGLAGDGGGTPETERLREVLALLRTRTGHDFTGYRMPTLLRRIQRRMALAGVTQLGAYAAVLREHQDELTSLANDLMINVTGFFRDGAAWDRLAELVLRPALAEREPGSTFRAWVTACASGEEAYSLAMLLTEEMERVDKPLTVRIFATDTADRSLALARAGIYPGGIEGDISQDRLDRFFDRTEHTYRVKKAIREMVVFAPQNVLRDPPFSRLDLCTCRNLLIYLEPQTQRHVLEMMHFALHEGGHLMLGSAEGFSAADFGFEALDRRSRIFRRVGGRSATVRDLQPFRTRTAEELRAGLTTTSDPASLSALAQRALLQRFVPPSVVVDRRDHIVFFHGDTQPYFRIPGGEPTRNVFELLRKSLAPVARQALRKAASDRAPASTTAVLDEDDGAPRTLRLTAEPVGDELQPGHFLLSFVGVPADEGKSALVATDPGQGGQDLEAEVRLLRRELESSVEAFEASNEELRASTEEVTSINEELQSANEELETSKEELQAVNEELITLNTQLQLKLGELEAANNDLSNLLGSTEIAVVFLDQQLHVRRFTPAIVDLIDLIPGDVGRPLTDLAHKFDGSSLAEEARQVLRRLVPIESETRSHSNRWYARRILPYRTADDHIGGVVVTFVDITARKQAESERRASETRLREVLQQLPAAVLLVEAGSGRLLFANRRAADCFADVLALRDSHLRWDAAPERMQGYHPNGEPYLPQAWPIARSLATGEVVADEEMSFEQRGGERRTFSVSSAPLRSDSGEISAVVAVFWETTDRAAAEQALRSADRRYRLVVQSARDFAIFTMDPEGRIDTWNTGAEAVLGWKEADIVGRPGAVTFTPEDRIAGAPEQEMHGAASTGEAIDERWHVRSDGQRFWASGVLAAARDESGKLWGYVKILRDETRRREAEERLHTATQEAERSRDQAEQANRAKDDFIATLSHELRTPLNTIRMWVKLLGSGRLGPKETADGIRMLDRAAGSQQRLIDDLLDVTRITSGKLRLEVRESALHGVLQAAVEAIHPAAEARDLKVEIRLDPHAGPVMVDPDRLQQVVWNLLSNAVKFTPAGGFVRVTQRQHRDRITITVSDSGVGIPREFLPHVFEPFRQAQAGTARQHTGLGLGLSIVRKLVELHGGTVRAASRGPGKGATFRVDLPILRSTSHPDRVSSVPGSPVRTNGRAGEPLAGKEILLVEDEEATREATQAFLESAGAHVVPASSAAAALDLFTLRRPTVVLSDVGLPGEDGYGLMRKLRQLEGPGERRVPAVALTAFSRGEDRARALEAGFDEHLPKAADPAALLDVLARLAG
jgi:two-component system, chemotaxis family, CheB/CheR fusion protein